MDVINEENSPKTTERKDDDSLIRGSVLRELQIRQRDDSDMTIFKKISISSNSKGI